jgi:hypothetical protein
MNENYVNAAHVARIMCMKCQIDCERENGARGNGDFYELIFREYFFRYFAWSGVSDKLLSLW